MKRDRFKELKVGDNVEVKFGIWKAIVVQYPLEVDNSGVCMYIICVY